MKTQSKLRKKDFTVVEQACHQIRGFKKLYEDLDDKVRLSGHSHSTLEDICRDHLNYDPDQCPHCKTGRLILME